MPKAKQMTLKEIKEMFAPGQVWHGVTIWPYMPDKPATNLRTVKEVRTVDVIFALEETPTKGYYTPWPKARGIKEARPGHLVFVYDNGVHVTLDLVRA